MRRDYLPGHAGGLRLSPNGGAGGLMRIENSTGVGNPDQIILNRADLSKEANDKLDEYQTHCLKHFGCELPVYWLMRD